VKAAWFVFNVLGIALNVGGACCALLAYGRTFKLHGKTLLFPGLTAFGHRVRGFFARFLPFLRRVVTLHAETGVLPLTGNLSCELKVKIAIPPDGPIEARVAAITRAVDALQQSLASEREARVASVASVESRLGGLTDRFTQSVDRLDAKVYDVGVRSLKLQIVGVFLVVLGTILLAVASLVLSPLL
jgi:hypothetical protein